MRRSILYLVMLLVPLCMSAQEVLPYPTDTIDGKVYYRYTVEKSIGLYRISKNFGVSQEAILQANPELRKRGLRFEEVILIPTNLPATPQPKVQAQEQPPVQESAEPTQTNDVASLLKVTQQTRSQRRDSLLRERQMKRVERLSATIEEPVAPQDNVLAHPVQTDSLQSDSMPADSSLPLTFTDTFRIAYLLPLQADVVHRSTAIDRFYDFYTGALLALKHYSGEYTDSLGQVHRMFYEVQTFDIGKNEQTLRELLLTDTLATADAVIGPAYSKQVALLSTYAEEHRLPVIVPFLSSVPQVSSNPYLMQFNPSDKMHAHELMNNFDTLRSQINLVLVDAPHAELPDGIRILRDSISARHLPVTHTSIRQILADSVGVALKDSVENILLFHSERYSNVQLLMPYLLSGRHGKRLSVLGQYAWQNERIVLPHLYTSVFRVPEEETVAQYEADRVYYFGHKLSSEQPRYDLLGYDLTSFLLRMLPAMRGGDRESLCKPFDGLQSSIRLVPVENGGFENTHIILHRK